MVETKPPTPSSTNIASTDCNVDTMFDHMKSFDYFRVGSPSKTFSDAKSSTTCWIKSTSLGILDFGSGISPSMNNATSSKTTTTGSTSTPDATTSGTFYKNLFPGDSLDFSKYLQTDVKISTSFSSRLEQLISEYLVAITVGAAVGAAVATGISIGILATSGMLRLSRDYVPLLWQWAFQRTKSNSSKANAIEYDSSANHGGINGTPSSPPESQVSVIRKGTPDQLVILKGCAKHHVSHSGCLDQCRECLDAVSALLSKQAMAWSHVKRVAVFLVADRCDAGMFRNVLSEYPLDQSSCIVSCLYVQRLEQAHAMVEIEVLAARDD
jgi:enamine deaminase RidA (YjgF/YER057c/UK114 family)